MKDTYSKNILFNFKANMTELFSSMSAFKVDFSKVIEDSFKRVAEKQGSSFGQYAGKKFVSISTKLFDSFASLVSNSLQELNKIVNYSLLSNIKTRELAFGYGLTGGRAYGFEKAKSLLGITSDEDLYYMNPQQRTIFQDYMTKYSEKYTKLYDSGFFDEYLKYQYEMADFKEDVQLQVVEFFMNNKDTIKNGMNALMTLADVTLKIFSTIVKQFGDGTITESERTAKVNDIINSYGGTSNIKNTKIDFNNTFNGVQSPEGGLLDIPELLYQRLATALK